MLSAIRSAEKSIYMEMYLFHDDTRGFDFLSELEASSRRGLRVILVMDILGSRDLSKDTVMRLRAAGVEVLYYSFFLRRTHRKILIVDEKIAFIGGVNIKGTFHSWKDLQIRVTGPVVRSIIRSYSRVYRECGGKDILLRNIVQRKVFQNSEPEKIELKLPAMTRAKLWFVEKGVGRRQYQLRKYYKERIESAKKSITFVTPYLFPPRWLIASLHKAILRGVAVEILLPNDTDHVYANWLNQSYVPFFTGLGARCYYSHGEMNHAKALLIDGREGMIGSPNLDLISFDWNIEAGVFFKEGDMVRDLTKIITGWRSDSILFDQSKRKFRWYDIVLAFLLRLFGFLPLW